MYSLVISIVSHGQGPLVKNLLKDLSALRPSQVFEVTIVLTLNIPESEDFLHDYLHKVKLVRNLRPLGFGANHNQAFAAFDSDYFLILNPDIRFSQSFLDQISLCHVQTWGCMGPIIRSPNGGIDDSARRYPTIARIASRVIFNRRGLDYDAQIRSPDVVWVQVEWLAGMFLLFKSSVFKQVGGFDTRYFMYLEDADICRRINSIGFSVVLNKEFFVVHDARRQSLKNAIHFRWHLRSMFRFIFRL